MATVAKAELGGNRICDSFPVWSMSQILSRAAEPVATIRSSRLIVLTVLVATLLAAAVPALAQETSCECESWDDAPGVLWAGCSPLTLPQVAELAAPALWFTRDEPLLLEENARPIPTRHPCDAPTDKAIVYYQITELVRRGDELTLPVEDDPEAFRKIDNAILKFFFYYPEDFGLGGHKHDLEAVEFHVFLEENDGCYRVRLDTAEALAHGSRWYSNILEIKSDTRFPLTVFVEEGKHGSAFDRNVDAQFTRGYDVNRQINDAWGVRDVLGAGVLLTSAYNPEMTKDRQLAYRVLPPETSLLQVRPANSSLQFSDEHLYRYELRRGDQVPACDDMGDNADKLESMMRYHRFGAAEEPGQYSSVSKSLRIGDPRTWLSVSVRLDDDLGVALVFKGLDMRQGWILPKVTVSGVDYTANVLFTPSASRFADYYISGGVRRQYDSVKRTSTIETENGRQEVTFIESPQWNFVTEVGLKLRANLTGRKRWAVLGYHFGGIRVGVQALGFGSLDDVRLIFEIGAGAW